MKQIIDRAFWDKRVPTRGELKALGLSTRVDRYSGEFRRSFLDNWEVRQTFIERFGFAVPSREVLERIATLSKSIVEVGAGTGFFASQLARFGVDIVATDLNTEHGYRFNIGEHRQIETLSAIDAVRVYPDRDVFSCWPSLGEDWLFEAARMIRPGRLLFYIGEGYGGCTADDKFHEFVGNPNEFEEVEVVDMVQFYGINDDLYVYRRLPGQSRLEHLTRRLAC